MTNPKLSALARCVDRAEWQDGVRVGRDDGAGADFNTLAIDRARGGSKSDDEFAGVRWEVTEDHEAQPARVLPDRWGRPWLRLADRLQCAWLSR